MSKSKWFSLSIAGLAISTSVQAAPITAVNYDTLNVGAMIVGPAGPEVETSLINSEGDSIGDLVSSVSCPAGFSECIPPDNSPGTIYTYAHTVTPGVDNPNDAPFPNPPTVKEFNNVAQFALHFTAYGFNGVAGYSFGDANNAGVTFAISTNETGQIIWETTSLDWNSGETITFFWQTTQPPTGPGGEYGISNDQGGGQGEGPLPAEPVDVTEPFAAIMFVLMGLALYRREPNQSV
ncbi:exosortase, PEP-CTERM interaction domain protein [Alteromonas sp. ASW11-130]|uniref:exosortase, PEP-CTERM interaction domain protein n=1 Tax=Alteromonas sp. ASW11-130 TaxID=3015775 RepID=UPI0022420A1D|nr:exosortase, PEP-CTERM interaction domain protein [Alteromonas sp. ASW11-130]MCW8092970.1 exosortase, PEP-CTERM interaction domain protein [Alteromonas sp. ASW11-130]